MSGNLIGENPIHHIITEPTHSITGTIAEKSTQILESITPPSLALRLPSFVIQKENGVFIQLEDIWNRAVFHSFLVYIFTSGYYFQNTNYVCIHKLLYHFEDTQKRFTEIAKKWNQKAEIKIASSIETFDPQRSQLYTKPKIARDKTSAEYFFCPVYMDKIDENNETKEVLAEINIDEFIAAMWKYGIQFWLDIETIKKSIQENISVRKVIAQSQNPSPSTDAKIEPVISFKIERWAREAIRGEKIDFLVYAQGFVEVWADTPLYKKIHRVQGETGWLLSGESLEPRIPKDIKMEDFVWERVYVEKRDGVEYIISGESGFPRLEINPKHQEAWPTKIHIDKVMLLKGVDTKTGKVLAWKGDDVESTEDINLETHGRDITAHKNVNANLHAERHIIIKGMINGAGKNHIIYSIHRKLGDLTQGLIVSDHGNISAQGKINNACLEAKKGTIDVNIVNNSIIFGKIVRLHKNIDNCLIVAEEIIADEGVNTSRCHMIITKNIHLHTTVEKYGVENRIDIFSLDLETSLQIKQKELWEIQKKLVELTKTLDCDIIGRLPKFKGLFADDNRRFEIEYHFVSLLANPEDIDKPEYTQYVQLFNALKTHLLQIPHRTRDAYLKAKNRSIQLTQEIAADSLAIQESQANCFITITKNKCLTLARQITSHEKKKLCEYTVAEIEEMIVLLTKNNIPELYTVTPIKNPHQGKFAWHKE